MGRKWLTSLTASLVVMLSCTPARAPDYTHDFYRFNVYVDEKLPMRWMEKGTKDWHRVTGDVFTLYTISHESAVALANTSKDLPYDTIIMVEATDDYPATFCGTSKLACCLEHAIYYFGGLITKDKMTTPWYPEDVGQHPSGSWDRVPAHEIGHYLGLDHIETRPSVMHVTTDRSTSEPTVADGELVWKKRGSHRSGGTSR